ncbi:MAG TPA: leucyl aminopeptidase [Oscillatoriaceae cyanobacterium]
MQVRTHAAPLSRLEADVLILGVPEKGLTERLKEADAAAGGAIALAMGPQFKGKAEETETLFPVQGLGAPRVVLVGLGEKPLDAESWRRVVSAGVEAARGRARRLAIALPEGLDAAVAAEGAAEAALLSAYEFHPYRTEQDPDEIAIEELILVGASAEAAERGAALARAVSWVRDLSNMPGNKLGVGDLVGQARDLAKSHGLAIHVIEGEDLVKEGLRLVHAVGRGSEMPPAFVTLEYRGAGKDAPVVALVGKGVTFDTGGINIKPRAGMEEMKTDMHGAATVLGVMRVASERKLPVNLVGVMAIAENMPNGNATVPGDVVKAYNGLTVEIVDTDAEGRLILADSLAYTVKNYRPEVVIDLATLTGSIIMALAYEASGLFTNSDSLAAALTAAGEATGERYWRMPIWDVYAEQVRSPIADLRNIGKEKGDAIHAAKFLQNFVGETPWAHLDIAGPSWISEPKPYRPKGSTGVGVRSLIHWLEQRPR